MIPIKKNEKRPAYLNRCEAGGLDLAEAAHHWRLNNTFRFDLPELRDNSKSLLPFKLENKEDELQLFVVQDIGDPMEGEDFVRALRENKTTPLDAEINTRGGSVDVAMGMFNAVAEHEGPTTARITGIAASSGMLLSQAFDKVFINETATMMAHPVQVALFAIHNDAQQVRDDAEFIAEMLDIGNDQITKMLSNRSGQPPKKVRDLIFAKGGNGTTLDAETAVELGFADEIIPLKQPKNELDKGLLGQAYNAMAELDRIEIERERLALA